MPKTNDTDPNAEILEITPQLAINWLSSVPDYQRRIDEKHVNKLIMAIRNGEWRINGAAIVFNEKGDLIDGQHRLQAIAKAGKAVRALVVTRVGKDDLTFASLGDSKSRRTADFIHTKNATVVAAVLRLLWFADNHLLLSGLKYQKGGPQLDNPPVAELVRLGKKHSEEIAAIVDAMKPALKILGVGAWAVFLMYYFRLYRPVEEVKKVAEFFGRTADGVGLEPGSPILHLRLRMLRPAANSSALTLPRRVREAIVLKALNFYLEDRKIDRLFWAQEKEPFPPLRGYDPETSPAPADRKEAQPKSQHKPEKGI